MENDRVLEARKELARRELARRGQSVSSNQPQKTESVATEGYGYMGKHPVKTTFEPAAKTLTGKSLLDRSRESFPTRLQIGKFQEPNWSYVPRATLEGLGSDIGAMAADIATTPATYMGGALAKPAMAVGKAVVKGIKTAPSTINKLVEPIRDYAGNKVLATRTGMKDFWKREVKEYGRAIDSLAGNDNVVRAEPLMENLTKQMIDRKLYDPLSEKWVKPLNQVDRQLLKSYETLTRKLKKGGELDVGSVVKEYQAIRDAAPIDSSFGREARISANNLINSVSDQLNIPAFQMANKRYSDFRTSFDAIDSKIDVWGNAIKTGKGERFLTRGLGESRETRKTGQRITEVTGQSLKGAKLLSAIHKFPGVKFLSR